MISVGVTAVGGGVGQAVLQSLSYSRMQWSTTGMDTRLLAPGLYWCDNSYLVPPVVKEEAYVERLCEIIRNEHLDVLIPGLDVELEPMARNRHAFEAEGCKVIVAGPEAVRLSHDKLALSDFCQERGLPFVQTFTVEGAQNAASSLSFPVIAKPKRGRASLGVRLIHDADELHALPAGEDLIVQEYLPPLSGSPKPGGIGRSLDQSDEWSIQFFVDGDREILGHFISRNNLKLGIPLEIMPEENEEVLHGARQIIEALAEEGLSGPVNIQGRETSEGVQFFEVNTRFTGITAVRASMGYLEVDAAVQALLLGRKEDARANLPFRTDLCSTRHVEHTTLPKARVERVRSTLQQKPVQHTNSEPAHERSLGTVLVTGASGYIGANLIQSLIEANDCDIVAAVRSSSQGEHVRDLVLGSDRVQIREGELPGAPWELEGINTVVHLSAARPAQVSNGDAPHFFEINVEGTRCLLAKARDAGVRRFVFASSQAVYGTNHRAPWTEMLTPQPDTPYGMSKWVVEQMCASLVPSDLEIVCLRLARVYGRGVRMQWDIFPHLFAKSVREDSVITVFGDGNQTVDLVHIRDVCTAIEKACHAHLPSRGFAAFNVGGGNPIPVCDVAHVFREKAQALGLEHPDIEYQMDDNVEVDFGMDIRRARAHLEWHPQVSMETAAEELLRAYDPITP